MAETTTLEPSRELELPPITRKDPSGLSMGGLVRWRAFPADSEGKAITLQRPSIPLARLRCWLT